MVDVLVQVFDRGKLQQVITQVPEEAFQPGHLCWKPVAVLYAAVEIGIPFVQVERAAKFGLRPADKARLRELYGETPHPSPAATPALEDASYSGTAGATARKFSTGPRPVESPEGEGFAGDEEDGGTGGPAPAGDEGTDCQCSVTEPHIDGEETGKTDSS